MRENSILLARLTITRFSLSYATRPSQRSPIRTTRFPIRRSRSPKTPSGTSKKASQPSNESWAHPPTGMWPSEGSVSDPVCALLAEEKIPFFATDEGILFRSTFIEGSSQDRRQLYRLHRLETAKGEIDCVFRDHGLSDLIGFVYQNWDPKEAARDFISHLKNIGTDWPEKTTAFGQRDSRRRKLLGILSARRSRLSPLFRGRDPQRSPNRSHKRSRIQGTPSSKADPALYPSGGRGSTRTIASGSAIKKTIRPGTFSGRRVKHWFKKNRNSTMRTKATAWKMLHIAEGSDWFWWYGDINSSAHDFLFDRLFRDHLIFLYEKIGEPAPESLKRPIKQPKKALKGGGVLFRQPVLYGHRPGYYEWVGTRSITAASGGGAMHQAKEIVADIRYGRLNKSLSLFVQFQDESPLNDSCKVRIHITKPLSKTLTVYPTERKDTVSLSGNIFEAVIDLHETGLEAHREAWFYLEFEPDGEPAFAIPHGSELYLHGYDAANASLYWFV